jgi:uncharacterized protein involved in exopolysaccharide biosynthesis
MTALGQRHPNPDGTVTLVELINILLMQRRLVMVVAFLVTASAVGWVLLQPRSYTSRAAFIPETSNSGGTLVSGGLASQLGLGGAANAGRGPHFYGSLLLSRPILEEAVRTRYPITDGTEMLLVDLAEVYGKSEGGSLETREEGTIRALRRDIEITVRPETGMVELGVRAENPGVAHAVAHRLLELLNEFDARRRRSEATEEVRFMSERRAAAREELRAAESELASFVSQNRRFSDPELSVQHDRLQREVAMRQRVYSALAESHETARIEEVRTTPVITTIAPPLLPAVPDRRGLGVKAPLALLAGLLLGVIAALTRDRFLRTREQDSEAFDRLQVLKGEALADLRRPLAMLGRSTRADPRLEERDPAG